jgi:signal transduction histidine kinase/ligand-binding sensor domain-containing protein
MRKIIINTLFMMLFLIQPVMMYSQQKIFNQISIPNFDASTSGGILGITQDQEGYICFIAKNKGLYRYDGSQFVSYVHDGKDSASITGARLESIAIDSDDVIWIGTWGGGLDKFDPLTNKFTHFRHRAADPGSLVQDTVAAVLIDHENNVWVGTYGGLDLYDRKTGKFIHHASKINDPTSLSSNEIRVIYEDRAGALWVGCGESFPPKNLDPNTGGLNRFDKVTGKFNRYLHNPANPNSIANNKVRAILEDSKGNFWVGTSGDGLQTLDRSTGVFTHYYYDSTHPQNLSRGPLFRERNFDHITFINEDSKGKIWIGTFFEGINEYDPQTKKIIHHGIYLKSFSPYKADAADTASGFADNVAWSCFSGGDGILWITTLSGALYKINPIDKVILPFTILPDNTLNQGGNTFYKDDSGTLWIGGTGLIRKNEITGAQKTYLHDDHNSNSLINSVVAAIAVDDYGIFWVGTSGGLDRFDPVKETFTHYLHDTTKISSLADNGINDVFIDGNKNLWIATGGGLDKMNTATGQFSHFRHTAKDSNSLSNNTVYLVAEDKMNIWAATANGLNKINKTSRAITHYLINSNVKCVTIDAADIVWAGTTEGIYRYNSAANNFSLFDNVNVKMYGILFIQEDDQHNLWISAANDIFKIDKDRKEVRIFGTANGVHENAFGSADNYKTKDEEIFIGDQLGYYHFFPRDVEEAGFPPIVNITSLQIGGKDIVPGAGSVLSDRINKTDKITLAHDQNSFAISFSSIHFQTPGEGRELYMMENYDNTWHDASATGKAYFFGLPVGHYILRVRAVNPDGVWAEKELSIVISPPWWTTWWAITIFALLLIAITWSFIYYRSRMLIRENKVLEEKVKHRTVQLQKSIEDLKSTQSQLVQSEKMASLGELTAGIAHEIQNPLNFVNNFSEVNTELIDELTNELNTGNTEEAILIAKDIKENEEKINHHGKRADAIVKGMLQHARSSTGVKEPTDINALADEYLRLSYHGLRAKDKEFNAIMKTDFGNAIGKINIIPQNIGRVLLNLYNNAFYAVTEKAKQQTNDYEPTISVATKKINNKVEITVKDNGNGIPQNIADKIFQPFFTTKPTGVGTGLGLSLSYDIIKAHGGEIKVETKEGEGSEFIIQLPINS